MPAKSWGKPLGMAVLCALALGACGTMDTREGLGTAIGAGVGGLVGSQIGSGTGKLIATSMGVAVGGYIGNRIGAYLDEQDKERMAASMQTAAATGQSQAWENPDTGASGSVTVTGQQTNSGEVQVAVLKDRVKEVPPLDLIGATYKTTHNANVRGGPGTDYRVVSSLQAGEAAKVVGKVQGSEWYLISEGGAASGFVFASLLEPAPDAAVAESAVPEGETETAVVQASQTCQLTTTTVKYADGRVEEEQIMLCPNADGSVEVRES